jgi:hypothetical protein
MLHSGCALIWGTTAELGTLVIEAFRDHLARTTGTSGVSLRVAVREGIPFMGVTLHGPRFDGLDAFTWFHDSTEFGRTLGRALQTSVSFLVYERHSDWEQITSIDRNGRTHVSSRSLEEASGAMATDGRGDEALEGLPLGVTAGINGLRRSHLESLLDDEPGVTVPLYEPLGNDFAARFAASKGACARDLDPTPTRAELLLDSSIVDDLIATGKRVRAKPGAVVESAWHIAIRAKLFDEARGPDGSRISPFLYRFPKLEPKRLKAAWRDMPPLAAEGPPRAIAMDLPLRLLCEIEELAAHLDRPVPFTIELAYRHGRSRDST